MPWINKRLFQLVRILLVAFQPALALLFVGILMFRFIFDLPRFSESIESLNFPLALILFILLFKHPIRVKLESMIEFKHRETSAKFQPSISKSQEESASIEFAQVVKEGSDRNFDQLEIENVMKMAASWGYNMAKMGFKSTPIPKIDWSNSQPSIKFGYSSPDKTLDLGEKDFIISKIVETQESLDGLSIFDRSATVSGLMPSRQSVLTKKLERLYSQLSEIDPSSSFLPKT